MRNKYFKGCLGKKGMTFIQGEVNQLALFEGYLDFLSWKHTLPLNRPAVLILNSVSFISAAIVRSSKFEAVDVFFDHDQSGRQATQQLLSAIPHAKDRSDIYAGHKDYNEKHMAEQAESMRIRSTSDVFKSLKVGFSR